MMGREQREEVSERPGDRRSRVKALGRLLAARATGGAFGATSRGVATLPVVMLRVLVRLESS